MPKSSAAEATYTPEPSRPCSPEICCLHACQSRFSSSLLLLPQHEQGFRQVDAPEGGTNLVTLGLSASFLQVWR